MVQLVRVAAPTPIYELGEGIQMGAAAAAAAATKGATAVGVFVD
jgi:hypothetical protein